MSKKDIKDKINKIHDDGANNTDIYAVYRKRKLHAQLLESQNDSQIIVFPSVDVPWYKMGWFSALVYAYDVGIRANTPKSQPVLRNDTDLSTRSRDGIVFIKDINKLIKKLSDIGINKYEITKDGIYIFELGKAYTKSEIKAFRNTCYRKNEELFNMTATKKVYPELRGLIVKAISLAFPKCKNLPSFYQETIAIRITTALMDMNQAYFDLANKRVEAKDGFITIVVNANIILDALTVLSEIKMWSPIELMEMGEIMVDIKMSVARILRKKENAKG